MKKVSDAVMWVAFGCRVLDEASNYIATCVSAEEAVTIVEIHNSIAEDAWKYRDLLD